MNGCGHSDLRGTGSKSKDGNTYLIVVENDCDSCPLIVDGSPWKYAIGTPGKVTPGKHTIGSNGGEIFFNIPDGSVYKFNYWGP